MPGRMHIFENGKYYHVFNRTIDGKRPFSSILNCKQFIRILWYYRSEEAIMKLSNFLKLTPTVQDLYAQRVYLPFTHRVSILAYCLMPTHFHLLLKQEKNHGISDFLGYVQNSFTKYFNIKTGRTGSLFHTRFRSKPILEEETLKHVARYIHLNPYSSGIIEDVNEIVNYRWSSMQELHPTFANLMLITRPDLLLLYFGDDRDRYEKFVLDNAEYQKTLEYCKYSSKW